MAISPYIDKGNIIENESNAISKILFSFIIYFVGFLTTTTTTTIRIFIEY